MPKLTVEGFAPVEVVEGTRLVLAIERDAGADVMHACGGRPDSGPALAPTITPEPDWVAR